MELTWLGHACFCLEAEGYRIVTDPYTEVEGYPELRTAAHQVVCSHGHHDHGAVGQVELLPPRPCPFAIREVESFHDEAVGALRGGNTIRVFTAGGISVAHLGDLGHMLTEAQLAGIGPVDGVLVPVGGIYTLDAAGAKRVCEALGCRFIVPMHYHHPPYGLPEVAGAEPFLALWPEAAVHRLEGPAFEAGPETAGVIVPVFRG